MRRPTLSGDFENLTSFRELYKPCTVCGTFHAVAVLDKGFSKEAAKRAEEIAKQIYKGTFEGSIDPELTALVAEQLRNAVIEGFGKDFSQMKYGDPDWNMLANLDKNVYQFAAAKNYQQLKDITLAVKDGDQIRSFTEFREIANKISFQYNENWLRTEYNTAIAGSQMAGKWVDFEANKESMPNLQYVTAGDDRVREDHQILDGVVKPIDDEFWDTYYPPNDWGCRCDVMQLPGDPPEYARDISEKDYPPVNPIFKTNIGKTGLIFPKNHSYFKEIPVEVLKNALKYIPPENAYRTLYKNVDVHILHMYRKEFPKNFTVAKKLADQGYDVKLLPVFEQNESNLRKIHLPFKGIKPNKYADALIDNKFIVEFETPIQKSKASIHNAIRHGKEQADIVLIDSPLKINDILRYSKGQLQHNPDLSELWIMKNNNLIMYQIKSVKTANKYLIDFAIKSKRR